MIVDCLIIASIVFMSFALIGVNFGQAAYNEDAYSGSDSQVADYTILIYMIGSTLEDENYAASHDIKEMLKANSNSHNVNLVLETGGANGKIDNKRPIDFSVTQRIKIANGTFTILESLGQANMGRSQTLSDFITWGMSKFPAKKYALILWNHGLGVGGFGLDTNMDRKDVLKLDELKEALSVSMLNSPNNFEFVGFDSCLMGTLEVASILTNPYPISKYLIASEETEPDWGWNYTNIVNTLFNNPKISGDLVGKEIIKSYVEDSKQISKEKEFHADRDITISVLDLAKISGLEHSLNNLVSSTNNVLSQKQALPEFLEAAGLTEHYGIVADIGIVDLSDYVTGLANNFPSLKEQVKVVKDELNSTVVYNYAGGSHPNSQGISIYMPLTISEAANLNNWTNNNILVLAYSPSWLIFVLNTLMTVSVDQTEPVLQSERSGNTIHAHLNDNDIKSIYLSMLLNSSAGDKKILYFQNLDPSSINSSGVFTYQPNKMLELCNENTCSPMSMSMEISKNVTKLFVPVDIKPPESEYKSVMLSFEQQNNNTFLFLGGLPESKAGIPLPKQKVGFEKGDYIYPLRMLPDSKYFYSPDSKEVKKRIDLRYNTKVLPYEGGIYVTDPGSVQLKWVNVNESISQFIFCDFADNCEKTRWYDINEGNPVSRKHDTNRLQAYILVLKNNTGLSNINNSNFIYVNERYNFTSVYPSNWIIKSVDLSDKEISSVDITDPLIMALYPASEILSTNGSGLNSVFSMGVVESKYYNDPKELYNYFVKTLSYGLLSNSLNYEIINSSSIVVDGYPGYEFFMKAMKESDKKFGITEARLSYYLSVIVGNKEYYMSFEAPESKFSKYYPTIKNFINSIKFNKFHYLNQVNTQYSISEEKNYIDGIRTDLKDNVKRSIVSKTYIDPRYRFTVLLPYMNDLNNVVTEYNNKLGYLATTILPSTNLPFEFPTDSVITIHVIDNSLITKNLDYLKSRLSSHQLSFSDINTMSENAITTNQLKGTRENNTFQRLLPHYKLLSSSNMTLSDGSFATVDEFSYLDPIARKETKEKVINTIDNSLFVSLTLSALPYEYDLYEPLFDDAVRSFRFIDKN